MLVDQRWEAQGNKEIWWSLTKGKFVIRFDIRIAIPKGYEWLGHFRRCRHKILGAAIEKEVQLHKDEAHRFLGHPGGEERTRATALALSFTLKRGKMHKCESCAIGKVKQKSVPRYSDLPNETKATKPCERTFLYMSLLKNPKNKDPNDKTPFISRSQMRLIHDGFLEVNLLNGLILRMQW